MKLTVILLLPVSAAAGTTIADLSKELIRTNAQGVVIRTVDCEELEKLKPEILAKPKEYFLIRFGLCTDRYMFRVSAPATHRAFTDEYKNVAGISIRAGSWEPGMICSTSRQLHAWFAKLQIGEESPWGKSRVSNSRRSVNREGRGRTVGFVRRDHGRGITFKASACA